MSPAEREFDDESIDDIKSDDLVGNLGVLPPDHQSDEYEPLP